MRRRTTITVDKANTEALIALGFNISAVCRAAIELKFREIVKPPVHHEEEMSFRGAFKDVDGVTKAAFSCNHCPVVSLASLRERRVNGFHRYGGAYLDPSARRLCTLGQVTKGENHEKS